MALGRKRLTCGAIKGLTVCCFYYEAVCYVFHCKRTALYCSAVQRDTKQHVYADRRETCIVYTQVCPLSAFPNDCWVPAGN
ncbi:unnamed protein product, partial [Staurois parvus]